MRFQYVCYPLLVLALVLFLLPITAVAGPPVNAVKFVILNPSDSTVGTPVTVTIEAQKTDSQVDISFQDDVTLVTSGSATGAGLVDIVNGVGTIEINDQVAETVILSLSDTEATGLDVDSTKEVVFASAEAEVWSQQKFLFRDDDGDEATASGFGDENVNQNTDIVNVPQGTAFRLRFSIKVSDADGTLTPRFEFKQGADCAVGSWTTITPTSDTFNLRLSDNFSDGDATTKQISGGNPDNFVPGKILELTNPASSLDLIKNEYAEYEWSLQAAEDITLGTTYSFRISNNGAVLDNYDVCPSLSTQPGPEPTSSSGGKVRPTTVTFSGRAFPDARILIVDKDVRFGFEKALNQNVVSDEDGVFQVSFVGITQGYHSFGLLIKDKENRTAQTEFFNVNTLTNDLVVEDVFVPPTVGLVKRLVTRGRNAIVTGYATPNNDVSIEIGDIIKEDVKVEKDGSYKVAVNTGVLEFGTHRVKVKQIDTSQEQESDYSPANAFVVSRLMLPETDLSGDGVVNIKDWSMFLSSWGSEDETQKKIIDFNDDGEINISDFSIFIRAIKK